MLNQLDIENKYSRNTIRSMVKKDVDTSSEVFTACVKAINTYLLKSYYPSKNKRLEELQQHTITLEEIALELFTAVLPYQVMTPIQPVATNLGNRLGYKYQLAGVKTAAEIIAVCESSGLYTIYHSGHVHNETETLAIQAHYKLSDGVIEHIGNTIFLPPMMCTPRKWRSKDNTGGGYLNDKGSCILGAINHHNFNQNLDHLNTLQNIAWEFNHRILELPETPNNPLETEEQMKQFIQFRDEAIMIRKLLLENGNRFFFKWKYDSGGRSYSTGYHVNLQSTSYQKACIQFKHKEVLTR